MWSKVCVLAILSLHGVLGQGGGSDPPRVDLGSELGVIEGKTMSTLGNLGADPKTYSTFRYIPYATGVAGSQDRYKQSVAWTAKLGNDTHPYDATRTGPMCYQGGYEEDALQETVDTDLSTLFEDLARNVLNSILPFDIPDGIAPGFVSDFVIDLLEELFKIDGLDEMTIGDLLEELLDVDASVSEECLHLTVSTPYDTNSANLAADLPVMFWVHGGGFTSGNNIHNDLARLGEGAADVVVVAINYRVGPIGFTCLDTDEAAGNMGMLDMVRALEWVQEHIAKFGGDKTKVTIFGESAGAAAIGHLVLSPDTDGLFSQGIGQSGSALSPWAFDKEPQYHAKQIAAFAGCEDYGDDDVLVGCLRALEPEEINAAFSEYEKSERLQARLGFGGTIPCAQTHGAEMFYSADEGETPESLLVAGDYRELPIFFGANSHEGSYVYGYLYNDYLGPLNKENDTDFLENEFIDTVLRACNIEQSYAIRDFLEEYYYEDYQMGNLELMTAGNIDILGAFFLKASSYGMVEYNSERAPSYWYSVEHVGEKKSMFNFIFLGNKPKYVQEKGLSGVSHADELPFLFDVRLPLVLCDLDEFMTALIEQMVECDFNTTCVGDLEGAFMQEWQECITGELTEEEQLWSQKMVRAWTNFAAHGDPTYEDGDNLPTLPAWTRDEPAYIAFRADGPSVQTDYSLTYNRVMQQFDAEYQGETGAGDDGGSGGENVAAASAVLAVSLLAAAIL